MGYAASVAEQECDDFEDDDWFDARVRGQLAEIEPVVRTRSHLRVVETIDHNDDERLGGPPTTAVGRALLADAVTEYRSRLGRSAFALFKPELERAVGWAERRHNGSKGTLRAFVHVAVRRAWTSFLTDGRFTSATLARELDDERARDAAASDPADLAAYVAHWTRRIKYLQSSNPARWKVRGMDDDEVRARVALHLVELVKRYQDAIYSAERAGAEATFILARRLIDRLRTEAEHVEASGYAAGELARHARDVPSTEELMISHQARHAAQAFVEQAPLIVTEPQRPYLFAMIQLARRDEPVTAANVARALGKDRSSATRALRSIAKRLARAGGRALVVDDKAPRRG